MTMASSSSEIRQNWKLLVTASLGLVCSAQVLPIYSIGAFVNPLEAEFGWGRAHIQAATVFAMGLGALFSPVIGGMLDRVGPKRLIVPGLIGVGLGYALAAIMQGMLWQFYLAYAFIAILGAGTIPVTWTRLVAGGFERQRGLALGIALSGTGICAIAAPHYVVWLTETFSWRVAFAGLALLPVAMALPLALLYIPGQRKSAAKATVRKEASTEALGPALSTRQLFASYRLWVLGISIAAVYLAVTGIAPNLIPALVDRGISAQAAATAVGVYGTSIILARLVVGWLLDRFWAPGVAAVVLTPGLFACLVFLSDASYPLLLFAAGLVGFAAGAELDLLAFLVTRYFGLRNYGKAYGILYSVVALGAGFGPMAFAYVYDLTASYRISFIIAATLFSIGGPILLTLGHYPRSEAMGATAQYAAKA